MIEAICLKDMSSTRLLNTGNGAVAVADAVWAFGSFIILIQENRR